MQTDGKGAGPQAEPIGGPLKSSPLGSMTVPLRGAFWPGTEACVSRRSWLREQGQGRLGLPLKRQLTPISRPLSRVLLCNIHFVLLTSMKVPLLGIDLGFDPKFLERTPKAQSIKKKN